MHKTFLNAGYASILLIQEVSLKNKSAYKNTRRLNFEYRQISLCNYFINNLISTTVKSRIYKINLNRTRKNYLNRTFKP